MAKKIKIKAIGILLLLALAIILVSYSSTNNSTGNIIFEPETPKNCTGTNISAIWETIFLEQPSGLTIKTNDTSGTNYCDTYLALKIINLNEMFLLMGDETDNEKKIVAIHGKFTPLFLSTTGTLSPQNLKLFLRDSLDIIDLNRSLNQTRNITTIAYANSNFTNIFKITPATLELKSTTNIYGSLEEDNEKTIILEIDADQVIEKYTFIKTIQGASGICTPVWTEELTTCNESETQTKYYDDSNNCNDYTNKPANEIIKCDHDSNNIIGNISDAEVSRITMEMEIGDKELNQSSTYTGKQNVTILNNNETIIEFEWDFNSRPLNMYDIRIKKQSSSSDFGYLIIEGIETNKTIRVDKIGSDSDSICIKNSSIDTIGSISDDCDDSDEFLVNCPGSNESYNCTISSNKFIVSGLKNSAVKEISEGTTSTISSNITTCSPNWTCGSWSNCVNGTKTHTCTDSNSCNNTSTRPNQSETCQETCYTNWDCTGWSPVECPESKTQTRTCSDLNTCGTETGKPSESITCTLEGIIEEGSSSLTFIIIIFMVIILLGTIGFLGFKYLNRDKGDTGSSSSNPSLPPAAPILNRPATMQRPGQPPIRRMMPPRRPPQNPNINRPLK